MSQVEFEEENDLALQSYSLEQEEGGIIGTLMRIGVAKSKTQANAIMIGAIVVCLGLIWFFTTRG